MSYRDVVQLLHLGFKHGVAESWVRAKYRDIRNTYPFSNMICMVCGRKPDHIYNFVTLTPVFFKHLTNDGWWLNGELGLLLEHGQSVMHVCEQHGGLWGATVTNCHTGDPVYFKPVQWYYPALDLAQGIILHASIYLRWLWFYLMYLYNWQIGYRIDYWIKYYAKK